MNVNASAQPKVVQRSASCSAQIIVLAVMSSGVPPALLEVLYQKYCSALARWHSTKSIRDRSALSQAYVEWAVAFLGAADSSVVIALAEKAWGAA